jgi:hypothetical protein
MDGEIIYYYFLQGLESSIRCCLIKKLISVEKISQSGNLFIVARYFVVQVLDRNKIK